MAQNFLYMLEFVVDDLLITRPNYCAPEEYPTCVELTFRSHVFVSICDKEFGGTIDTAKKSGKCCLFSLETPINRNDRLQIHVYKKRTEQCKFLIGQTEIPIHRMFDKVTEDFYCRNPTWDAHLKNPKLAAKNNITKKGKVVIDNECGLESAGRKEELCPTFELSKKLLALSNLNGSLQTGNIVLIMRLACMGPTIVSPFLFGKPPSTPERVSVSCEKPEVNDAKQCKRYFGSNAEKGCPCTSCQDEEGRSATSKKTNKTTKEKSNNNTNCCPQAVSRGCPCPDCDEECEMADDDHKGRNDDDDCPCSCACVRSHAQAVARSASHAPNHENDPATEEEEDEEENSVIEMKNCILCNKKSEPGPEKYDEFEANLNGSGLTIRVLKESHTVENIYDIEPDDVDIDKCNTKKNGKSSNYKQCMDNLNNIVTNCSVARNYIAKRTGGNIVNDKSLPVVRGNIKYSGNDSCVGDNAIVPLLNKLPTPKNVDDYRKYPSDIRNCCFQVNPCDIDGTLRGINAQAKKNGIEICRTKFDDPDTDVFLVKLGNKKPSKNKQCSIEIELRTPKEPSNIRAQKWTKETQVDESILDAKIKKRKPKKKPNVKRRCYK